MTPEQITLVQSPSERLSPQRPPRTTGSSRSCSCETRRCAVPYYRLARREVKFGHELTGLPLVAWRHRLAGRGDGKEQPAPPTRQRGE